jgi:hypothetical protein
VGPSEQHSRGHHDGDSSAAERRQNGLGESARARNRSLQSESAICGDCPALSAAELGGHGEALGCLGESTIRLMLSLKSSSLIVCNSSLTRWIAKTGPAVHIAVDPESPFDGEATKELRRVTTKDGLRFFELRVPIKLARAGETYTDNLFDLIAGFRSQDPTRQAIRASSR